MANLSKSALLARITTALEDGGWSYIIGSSQHPFEISLVRGDDFRRCRIYIWNITHGGENRPKNEYRIQATGVAQFNVAGVDSTAVLGWWEEVGVFAGFDVSKHLAALGASPSFQIRREVLVAARADQMATQEKGNGEIAIAFVPALLGDYLENLTNLQQIGASAPDLALLTQVIQAPQDPAAAIAQASSQERQTVLTTVARKLRDQSFGQRVLTAYQFRCAMCDVQLRLVEAAHIVPVQSVNDDETSNGIALCTLHHRAYDRRLVTMLPDYTVALNPLRVKELEEEDRVGGISKFRENLRPVIAFPADVHLRPSAAKITHANELRGWVEFEQLS
jgi:putative restriction endonuclease